MAEADGGPGGCRSSRTNFLSDPLVLLLSLVVRCTVYPKPRPSHGSALVGTNVPYFVPMVRRLATACEVCGNAGCV